MRAGGRGCVFLGGGCDLSAGFRIKIPDRLAGRKLGVCLSHAKDRLHLVILGDTPTGDSAFFGSCEAHHIIYYPVVVDLPVVIQGDQGGAAAWLWGHLGDTGSPSCVAESQTQYYVCNPHHRITYRKNPPKT